MDRINGANTVDIGGGKRGWRKKNKAAGISGTEITDDYMNSVQEELLAMIEALGLVPSDADRKQVLKAIRSQRINWVGNFAGTATALSCAPTPAFTALADLVGVPIVGKVANASTGATTLSVNGLAAQAVVWPDGTAIAAGELPAGGVVTFRWDGANFVLHHALSPSQIAGRLTGVVLTAPTGGARQSVSGPLSISGGTNTAPLGGALSGLFVHNGDPAYGLRAGVVAGDGRSWVQAGRVDGAATYYNLTLNELGGRVAVGHSAPLSLLDINGGLTMRADIGGPSTAHAYTIGANPVGDTVSGGFVQFYGSTAAGANQATVWLGSAGSLHFGINRYGAINVSNWYGNAGQVLTSQGSSAPAQYRNAIDLLSTAELRAKIGGKIIVAIGYFSATSSSVTFATAEPDTAYQVVGYATWPSATDYSNGGQSTSLTLSAKTTSGCTISVPAAATPPSGFYIIYR